MLRQVLGEDGLPYLPQIFAYLFNNISKYDYRDSFENRAFAKQLWSKVENSGYIIKNCKLYLYAAHCNRQLGLPTSPAKFEIEAADLVLLKKLELKFPKKTYKAYSLFDFDNMEGALIWSKATRNYMGRYINKKLRFLYSYGLTYSEIEAQLAEYALWVLRKHYPVYETELHAQNICKTAIHNMGMLLIQHWTRDKRQTLSKETDGTFQSRFVQLEYVSEVQVRPEHELQSDSWDLASVTKRLNSTHSKIFSALSGNFDAGVTMFLGCSNTDAAHQWDFQRYLSAVAEYHQVSVNEVLNLLQTVRAQFEIRS